MNNTIQSTLSILARGIGDEMGINVVFHHGQAMMRFDQSRIYLPIGDESDSEYIEMTYGYTAHECAHFRFTDPNICNAVDFDRLRFGFHNIIEDIWIEKAIGTIYPGFKIYIDRLNTLMVKKGMYAGSSADMTPMQLITNYMLSVGYFTVSGLVAFQPLAEQSRLTLQSELGPSVENTLYQLILEIKTIDTSSAALEISDKFLEFLKDLSQKNQQQSQDEDQSSQQSGNDSNEDDSSSDESETQESTSGESDSETEAQDAQASDTAEDKENDGPVESSSESIDANGDDEQGAQASNASQASDTSESDDKLAEFANSVLNAGDDEVPGDKTDQIKQLLNQCADEARENGTTFVEPYFPQIGVHSRVSDRLMTEVSSESACVRHGLSGLLQAKKPARRRRATTGSRVDPRRIHRIAQGDNTIFVRSNKIKAINTAFYLLVDTSDSMNWDKGERLKQARHASLALSIALDGIQNVSVETACFPHYTQNFQGDWEGGINVIKPFNSRSESVSFGFNFYADGDTPTAEAVLGAAYRLIARKEERKILFVLTDGEPNDHFELDQVLERCKNSNIECVGIGIKANASGFPHNIRVNNLSELSTSLITLARQILLAA
jgi:hypothetical protein